jgi:MoaA/NifB/PqqE/SkfB family radical SAM enzyme
MSRFDWKGTLGLPQMIDFEPTETCNLRCRMCHVSFAETVPTTVFDAGLIKRMRSLRGAFVAVGSGFEPMMHPHFARIVADLSNLDMRLQLITNGTYCNDAGIAALAAANMFMINFSFDGIHPSTYEHIPRRANFANTLAKITATREAFAGRETFFAINSTCQRQNLEETIETIDFWDERGFDMVRFLLMVVRYPHADLVTQSLYPLRDRARTIFDEAARHVIRHDKRIAMQRLFHHRSPVNAEHPNNVRDRWVFSGRNDVRCAPNYRETYQYGAHPEMPHFPCRAAFNSVSILANGDVQMCYKYTVGNLHTADFEDIWYGEKADAVRRRMVADATECRACDCYRYGISLRTLDDDDIGSHFSHDIIPHLDTVDFETGAIAMPPRPPRLVATEGSYNVVFYDRQYIAVPHTAGPLEVDKVDLAAIAGVIVADRYPAVVDSIRRQSPAR